MTSAGRASNPDAAHDFIQGMRDEMPDATHHCWAFAAGAPGDTAQVGMSDAGEPHGTAGRPMLTALLHGGVGEIVVVCTRWFGGVKLGTGGLSRAYAGCVNQLLESLPVVERVDRTDVVVVAGYEDVDALKRLAEEGDAVLEEETYGADVRLGFGVAVGRVDAFRGAVADVTQGRARMEGDG